MSGYLLPSGDLIELGTTVRARARLERGTDGRWRNKVWRRRDLPAPAEGIVTGVRTLANGTIEGGADESMYFVAEDYVRAALVTVHLSRRPLVVPFDALEVVS